MTGVRPYFQSIMKDLGFDEWRKSLEPDNIPKSLIKKVYHLQIGSIQGLSQNQQALDMSVSVTVSFLVSGGRDEMSGIEDAERVALGIIREAVSVSKKILAEGIVNVEFQSQTNEAISGRNDNLVLSRLTFSARVIISV